MKGNYGTQIAEDRLDEFFNRKVFPITPYMIGVGIGMTNEQGLAGLPLGSIIEMAGITGSGKTCIAEHVLRDILNENKENEAIWLSFESTNWARTKNVGVDLSRVHTLDYAATDEEGEALLKKAEQGLDLLLDIAFREPTVKICIIDSLGAMAVSGEVFAKKGSSEFASSEDTPQMAVRAQKYTNWINRWDTLNTNTRPILLCLNHFKKKIEKTGIAAYKDAVIGADLRPDTLCGTGKDHLADLRFKTDSKKIYLMKGGEAVKHELYDNKIQIGLELYPEMYRNRYQIGGETGAKDFCEKFYFEGGFDLSSVLAAADHIGIINSTSQSWDIEGKKIKKSMPTVNTWAQENPELFTEIKIELAKKDNRDRLFKTPKGVNSKKEDKKAGDVL